MSEQPKKRRMPGKPPRRSAASSPRSQSREASISADSTKSREATGAAESRGESRTAVESVEPVEPELVSDDVNEGEADEVLVEDDAAVDGTSWLGDTDALALSDEDMDMEEGEEAGDGKEASTTTRAIVPSKQALARSTTDVEPTDLLHRYMADVSRYPLLTREEEIELAKKYAETGDVKLAYRLVTANLRLVVKIAWEYRRAAFNLLDLIQEGNVGLMQAVRKYDVTRNVKLSTYAAWWIRAYIIRYLMDNWRLVKLGTTQAQRKLFFNLRKEKERLAAQGFEPEPRLLAERLQVSEQDIVEMDTRLSSDDFSLDTPVSDDSKATWGDRLTDGSDTFVDDELADRQLDSIFREKLADFAKDLKDRERFIFEKRLIAEDPLTLQEIGDHYGFSRERARQIEARLVAKMKAYMQENLPDFAQLQLNPDDS